MSDEVKTDIPQTLHVFGKAWVYQDDFTDRPEELATCKKNWQNAGHTCMVKKKTRLYVTQFKTRSW